MPQYYIIWHLKLCIFVILSMCRCYVDHAAEWQDQSRTLYVNPQLSDVPSLPLEIKVYNKLQIPFILIGRSRMFLMSEGKMRTYYSLLHKQILFHGQVSARLLRCTVFHHPHPHLCVFYRAILIDCNIFYCHSLQWVWTCFQNN